MDDLISRQAALEAVEKSMYENPHENEIHRGMHDHEHRHFLTILMELPSVQPEIIRCKECLMHGVCRFEQGLGLDGYCSQAERRSDDRSD